MSTQKCHDVPRCLHSRWGVMDSGRGEEPSDSLGLAEVVSVWCPTARRGVELGESVVNDDLVELIV